MEQTLKICNLKVHYRCCGSGPAIILMHGWGCDSTTLLSLERVCALSHTVYNLDLPGFGQSQEPPSDWGVEEYTRLLEEFVAHLQLQSPTLLGHSYGGRIAILYASRNVVERLILVDAAGVPPRHSLRYYFKVYSFKLMRHLAPLVLGRKKADELIERQRAKSGSADYRNSSPVMRQIMVRSIRRDLRPEMPLIKAPTLLIWGENDTATPMRDARIMQHLIPGARLTSFAGAGHYSFLDNPYATEAAIKRFLNNSAAK